MIISLNELRCDVLTYLDIQPVVLKCWVELKDNWLLEGGSHHLVLDEKVSEVQYD